MRLRWTAFAIAAILLIGAIVVTPAAPQGESARLLLEAARKKEVVDGNLEAAIQLYRDVLARFPADRVSGAEALLGVASGLQKMGRPEAVAAYERIVREYADQPAAAIAQVRLAALIPPPPPSRLVPADNPPPQSPVRGGTGPRAGAAARGNGARGASAEMVFLNRAGTVLRKFPDPGLRGNVTFSPDGQRVARAVPGDGVYVIDVVSGLQTKVVSDSGTNSPCFWFPDGQQIAFQSSRSGNGPGIHVASSDGQGTVELLFGPIPDYKGASASVDGRFVVYHGDSGAGLGMDLWALPLARGSKPTLILATSAAESGARISPDGRFYGYRSDEGRRNEIYVRAFDTLTKFDPARPGEKWKISTTGSGGMVRWRIDGRELYFLDSAGDVMVVDTTTTPSFSAGVPRVLFTTPQAFKLSGSPGQFADVSADGERFVLLVPVQP